MKKEWLILWSKVGDKDIGETEDHKKIAIATLHVAIA